MVTVMVSVRDLLRDKSNALYTIPPDATVFRALQVMAEHDVGALPVVAGGQLIGMFSERDYARKVVLDGRSSRDTRVADLMVRSVVCVSLTDSVQDCMALMTEKRVRHLPVMDGDRLVAIITIGDVVKRVLVEQQHTIEDLETYIRGAY